MIRRAALALALLVAVPAARVAADDPTPSADGFWSEDELKLIDKGLAVLNCDRKDLQFQKRPLDDPFRLPLVNRVLDDPLSIGPITRAWDDVARKGKAGELLSLARSALDLVPGPETVRAPTGEEHGSALPMPLFIPMFTFLPALVAARDVGVKIRAPLGEDSEAVLLRALKTQREEGDAKPVEGEMKIEEFLAIAAKADRSAPVDAALDLVGAVSELVTALRELKPDAVSIPPAGIRLETKAGAVVLSGTGDDVHDEGDEVCCVIDLGGNDTWKRGASASGKRALSVCIDLAGDDRYVGRQDLSFGAALGGVAIQWDVAGDDLYDGGHCSCGAGILGVGILVDEAGDDLYRCKDFGEGAGAFGVGILLDRAGNDYRHADLFGQGFASTWGCGVCADLLGNDVYDAGGVHSDAPLHRDRTTSLSQGFGFGMRPDASGGVGVLVDVAGNDRYSADIFGQGCSYWFSLGILIDDDGNDTYVLGHYGQGSGIHLSAGMLLDRSGQDLYYTEYGVGIGGAHDYAVGFLVDRGGDDHYDGSGAAQGMALSNSVAMLIDMGGDDGYTSVRGGSQGSAGAARDTGGIGLLLDAGGKDAYSEPTRDGRLWVDGALGAGLDEAPPPGAPPPPDPMGAEITKEAATAKVDAEGTVAGEGGKRVDDLDKLWAIAIRWQVGDERVIGPIARERLVAMGAKTLDRAISRLGSKDGLELECCQAVLERLPRGEVVPKLLEATKATDVAARRTAVRFVAALKVAEAEPRLVELLADGEIRANVLRALAALGKAPPAVLPYLRSRKEPEGVATTLCLAAVGDDAAIAALVEALAPDVAFPVRLAAEQRLSALGEKAVPALSKAAASTKTVRERRSALRALGGTKSKEAVPAVRSAFADPDAFVRLSAYFAADALSKALPPDAAKELAAGLAARRAAETETLLQRLR